MATTLYLTNAAAPYTPATLRGAWDDTAAGVTRALDTTTAGGGAITSVARAETNASTTWDVLLYRGVSGPLAAQTISGTVDVVVGVSESNAAADFFWHLHIYCTQGDSDTPRGTLLTDYVENTTNEWPTTAVGVGLQSAQTLTSVAISDGDRLVAELGYIARNNSTTSRTGTLRYGTLHPDTLAPVADLSVGSSNVTTLAGFLTFSNTLTEAALEGRISQAVVEAAYSGPGAGRVSQAVVEALRDTRSFGLVSQAVVEAAYGGPGAGRISQAVIELLCTPIVVAETSCPCLFLTSGF